MTPEHPPDSIRHQKMSDAGSDADILLSEIPLSNQAIYDRAIEECFKYHVGPKVAKLATSIVNDTLSYPPKKEDLVKLGSDILDASAEFGVKNSTEVLKLIEEACECSFADKEAGKTWLATAFSRCVRQHVLADKMHEIDELYGTALKTKPATMKLQSVRWAAMSESLDEIHPLLIVDDPLPEEDNEESDCSDIDSEDYDSEDEEDDEEEASGDEEGVAIDPFDLKQEAKELGVKKRKYMDHVQTEESAAVEK